MIATAQASASIWLGSREKTVWMPGRASTTIAREHGMIARAGISNPCRSSFFIAVSLPSALARLIRGNRAVRIDVVMKLCGSMKMRKALS